MLRIEPQNTEGVKESIVEIEKEFNIELPNDYKKFLIKYNGGFCPRTKIKKRDIDGFYGVNKAENNISKHINNSNTVSFIGNQFYTDLSKGMFMIGYYLGGYIYINTDKSSDKYGHIYGRENSTRGRIYHHICDSFRELVEKAITPDYEPPKSVEENKARLIAMGWGDKITPELIEIWDRQYKNRREIHYVPVELD